MFQWNCWAYSKRNENMLWFVSKWANRYGKNKRTNKPKNWKKTNAKYRCCRCRRCRRRHWCHTMNEITDSSSARSKNNIFFTAPRVRLIDEPYTISSYLKSTRLPHSSKDFAYILLLFSFLFRVFANRRIPCDVCWCTVRLHFSHNCWTAVDAIDNRQSTTIHNTVCRMHHIDAYHVELISMYGMCTCSNISFVKRATHIIVWSSVSLTTTRATMTAIFIAYAMRPNTLCMFCYEEATTDEKTRKRKRLVFPCCISTSQLYHSSSTISV